MDLTTSDQHSDEEAQLSINMILTNQGFEHIEEIIQHVFSYLKRIQQQGVTQERFNELQRENELAFTFLEQAEPVQTAITLATGLTIRPPEELIRGLFLYRDFAPDTIQHYLALMTPNTMRMLVASQSFLPSVPSDSVQTEPWTGAVYSVRSLSEEQKKHMLSSEHNTTFTLPPQNPFMPGNLELISEETTGKPVVITSSEGLEVWFLHDNVFNVPRSNLYIRFALPNAVGTPQNSIRFSLYQDLVIESFNETAYQALLSGLDYNLSSDYRGLTVQVYGFNDRLSHFLQSLLTQLKHLNITQAAFDKEKEALKDAILNLRHEDPTDQLLETMRQALYTHAFSPEELLAALDNVALTDLQNWSDRLFSKSSVTALIHGNMSKESAEKIAENAETLVVGPDNNHVSSKPLRVPEKPKLPICSIRYHNDDASLMVLMQGGQKDHQTRATYKLLKQFAFCSILYPAKNKRAVRLPCLVD